MLYPHSHLPEQQIVDQVRAMSMEDRMAVMRAYVGERANRRHKPGRALERVDYRFDVLADYGAFRDLQRHRMLTIEWQALSPRHGYTRPEAVDLAGATAAFDAAMERSAALHDVLVDHFPAQAPYAVCLAYKVRFVHAAQRPRGDAPHRAALAGPRATPPTGPWPRRCTASSPRRPATRWWPR